MSDYFKTIENGRPEFFAELSMADYLARLGPFNDERDERIKVDRAKHLQTAREQLDILERAYHDDLRRMTEKFNRVLAGKPMNEDTEA